MKMFCSLGRLAPLALVLATSSCVILSVYSDSEPPSIQSHGILDGHAAFGIRDEHQAFHARLFGGSSPGAIGEIVVWKLFRAELGLAGLSIGVGPFDFALGVLFYDPEIPTFVGTHLDEERPAPTDEAQSVPASGS